LKLREEELRGRDEVITKLKDNIKKIQLQLDALRDCKNQENPLESLVDDLKAKNIELQVSLKSLQEKADQELHKIKALYESQLQNSINKPKISDPQVQSKPSITVSQANNLDQDSKI
jgi:hypothetical protein